MSEIRPLMNRCVRNVSKGAASLAVILFFIVAAACSLAPSVEKSLPPAEESTVAGNKDVTPDVVFPPTIEIGTPTALSLPLSNAELSEKILSNTAVKPRDLNDLAKRLKGAKTEGKVPVVAKHDAFTVGRKDRFWVTSYQGHQSTQVNAELRVVTQHAYFYVGEDTSANQSDLEKAAQVFEDVIYPTNRKYFGSEWTPGIDNDEHITVLNLGDAGGAGGFFSAPDESARSVNPYSNEREMIYISLQSFPLASNAYLTALAHEFQHMIAWNQKLRGEEWIEEGMAVMASRLTGFPGIEEIQAFSSNPDTQLNAWSDGSVSARSHYGASFLFLDYLVQRFGDPGILTAIQSEPDDSFRAIDAALAKKESSLTSRELFKDWVVANYLDEPFSNDGRFNYKDVDIRASLREDIRTSTGRRQGTVHQYAATYLGIETRGRDFAVTFTGAENVKLIPGDPHSGQRFWWSNRGDEMDSTLTKEFDLSNLKSASLHFWTWYDIEKGFDFAYVELSTDGGITWQMLRGNLTSADNPTGNNLGFGFTGGSGVAGPGWVEENLNLTPYTGGKVMIRFEYVTDEVYNGNGFALDDVSIPELGFYDNAEDSDQWVADGFVRVYNVVPQRFLVQLITTGKQTEVKDITLNRMNAGEMSLKGDDIQRAVLVISGLSPTTIQKAEYGYSVSISGQ